MTTKQVQKAKQALVLANQPDAIAKIRERCGKKEHLSEDVVGYVEALIAQLKLHDGIDVFLPKTLFQIRTRCKAKRALRLDLIDTVLDLVAPLFTEEE